MNLRKSFHIIVYLILFWFAGIYLLSCTKDPVHKRILVTRVPAGNLHPEQAVPAWSGASLVMIRTGGNRKQTELLTSDFFSACSPQVSYDATHILFSGQKEKNDPWQVWEMNLKKKTTRQVTHCKESCYTPFYLPGNHLAFTRAMQDTGTGTFLTLFTMNLDGTNLQQITFHPHEDLIATILKDGRILIRSKQVYPDTGAVKYLAIRPNGTKIELFYSGASGTLPGTQVHETTDGMIWFTERNAGNPGKEDIIRIRYNRPLHSRVNYTANIPGDFYTVLPTDDSTYFVSYRKPGDRHIGLFTFSSPDKSPGKALLNDDHFHFLDPVLLQPYERPRNLPNELMLSYPTGLLMSQNIYLTADSIAGSIKASQIEVLGMDHSLGVVPVEKDGSFFLKIPADMPFRIQTLDQNRHVVQGPSDWLWLRPFERRGCAGCHEYPELSPQNIVPLAINTWPVIIPVDTTKSKVKAETFKVSNMK